MINDENTTPVPEPEEARKPGENQSEAEATETAVEPTSTPEPETTPVPDPEPEAQEAPASAEAEPEQEPEMLLESAEEAAALFEEEMRKLGSDDPGEGAFKKLAKGDKVEARVIQVEKDRVFVDLGTKVEGVVPLSELSQDDIENATDHVKVGDIIKVVVIKPEGAEGAIVSKKMADFELVWDDIEEAFREGRTIKAQVVDRVKGGLVVDIGVRGFVPATHVGNGRLRNIDRFVGESLDFKVLEIDRDRRKVVLSNRQAEDERRTEARDTIFNRVAVGDVLDGVVRRLTDYGAFVDLGGVDGLLHISEMSWMRISHPKDVIKEGQEIQVKVLRLDPENSKISLSYRDVLPDPWKAIRENYRIGMKFTCKIGRNVPNGSFVRLPEGAEAFIPVSEISTRRVRRPEDAVQEGDEVEVSVIDLRPEERRMVLSLRAAGGDMSGARPQQSEGGAPSYDDDERKRAGKRRSAGGKRGRRGEDEEFEEVLGRRGFGGGTGGATIGERLGKLKGLLVGEDVDEDLETPAEEKTEEETEA